MFSKIRSLLFKLDPEIAHNLAIKSLKFNFIPQKKIITENSIKTEIFGKKIPNPIGVAAGFDKNAEVYNSLFGLGFGLVEVGTVTPVSQYGNPKPRIFRLEEDEALINRLGFNNSGSDSVRSRITSNSPKGLFGVNIGPNKDTNNRIEDYINGLHKFYDVADYITINISSPNTENLRNFHNQNELNQLLSLIKKEKKKLNTLVPIVVKISPDIENENINKISDLLMEHNVEAVIISNTTDKYRDSLKNINKLEKGGLSGKPLEKRSNELINKFYKILKNKIKIIGVGGVDSGQSAYEKLVSGASIIQLYTGMIYKGPKIATKINQELIKILYKERVKNISDLVGIKN
jgi:dihydroorotate dehydrogenase|tara:strand:+ start:2997 stop:4037 length:1041 start_codon:yes stop_codon:yes gene_type:complete